MISLSQSSSFLLLLLIFIHSFYFSFSFFDSMLFYKIRQKTRITLLVVVWIEVRTIGKKIVDFIFKMSYNSTFIASIFFLFFFGFFFFFIFVFSGLIIYSFYCVVRQMMKSFFLFVFFFLLICNFFQEIKPKSNLKSK